MSEPLLTMRGIVKAFSGVKALDGIDLTVAPGECVGLCGENGAGKSTLMKVLSGVYPHGTWDGEIIWEGEPLKATSIRDTERAGIIIIHQELMLVPEFSVAENIFLGNEITLPGGRMNYAAMYQRADELLRELGISGINSAQPVMNYGGGHQQLIEIAKALNKRAKLLILDEPSSSLTATEIHILLDIVRDLKRRGVACVYISHKLDEVAAVCDTISVIRDGRHVATEPMRALTTDRIISLMVGREIKNLFPREPHPIGDVIFEARHVTCFDVNNPRRKRVNDVSFALRRGEILGVAGLVGAGRTELMQAIFGAYPGVSEATVVMDGKPLKIRAPCRCDSRRYRHGAGRSQAPRHRAGSECRPQHHARGVATFREGRPHRFRRRTRHDSHGDEAAFGARGASDALDCESVGRQSAEGRADAHAADRPEGADSRRTDARRRCRCEVSKSTN